MGRKQVKKTAVATCGALDWQAKQAVAWLSRGIWHARVRAELNQGHATGCGNVYPCCICRSEEAPGPRDYAAEASRQQLASTPRGVARSAVARQPSGSLIGAMRSHDRPAQPCRQRRRPPRSSPGLVCSDRRPPPPPSDGLVRSDIARGRRRGHFHGGDVHHGRRAASSGSAGLRSSPPRDLVRDQHAQGRPARLRPPEATSPRRPSPPVPAALPSPTRSPPPPRVTGATAAIDEENTRFRRKGHRRWGRT